MKKYHKILKTIVIICLGVMFIQCSDNDDDIIQKTTIPLFSESDLSTIHNNSDKQWRITEVINKYYDPNYHLEIELSCLEDDIYTFFESQEKVEVDLGESRCFGQNDDGIFTADIEIFELKLQYMGIVDTDDKTIFLQFSRGFINEDSTATGISIRWYKLAELTEDRMVFHREGGEYVGEYNQALVFETIEK